LLAISGLEPIPEVAMGGPWRAGGSRLHRTNRAAGVLTHHDAVARPEHLEPDVVAERIATRPGNDHEAASRQMQDGRSDIDVFELAHPGSVEAGADGIHLGDLFSADEANRVEVVDVEIAEDPAGGGDVLRRRGNR